MTSRRSDRTCRAQSVRSTVKVWSTTKSTVLVTSIKQTWLWCGFLYYMNMGTSIEIGSSLQLEIWELEELEAECRTKEKECRTIEEDFGDKEFVKYLVLDGIHYVTSRPMLFHYTRRRK